MGEKLEAMNSIKRKLTARLTPQQNSVVERKKLHYSRDDPCQEETDIPQHDYKIINVIKP